MTMASGVYGTTLEDILDNDTAVDLTADTINAELVTDTHTPNFSTHTTETDITNEVTGTGIAAGGQALDTFTTTAATGTLTMDAADEAWTTATGSSIRGTVAYDDTITTPTADPLVFAVTFGADYSVTAGTFTIQWNASGIWTVDFTP